MLLDTIFMLTANLTEFQRQIVNPNAAKFASALVALVDKADTDTQARPSSEPSRYIA